MIDIFQQSVVLNMRMEGSNGSSVITDDCGNVVTINGSTVLSSTTSAYGNTSAMFNGTSGTYISIPGSSYWNFSNQDFTIELWYYKISNAANGAYTRVFQFADGDVYSSISVADASPSGKLSISFSSNGTSWDLYSADYATAIPTGQWTHFAFTRFGNTFSFYVNGIGTVLFTNSASLYFNASLPFTAGGQSGVNRTMNGYIDNIRVTKGASRYLTNFTPTDIPVSAPYIAIRRAHQSLTTVSLTLPLITSNYQVKSSLSLNHNKQDIITVNDCVNDNSSNIIGNSTFTISGNAITPSGMCLRVLFINSKYEMEASVVPNNNGDFIYYCNNDTYTVIMIGPGNIETKVFYNVHPVQSNSQ